MPRAALEQQLHLTPPTFDWESVHHPDIMWWREAIKASDLEKNAKMVALLMADAPAVPRDTRLSVGVKTLQKQGRLSRATVYLVLGVLRDAGWLIQVAEAVGDSPPVYETRIPAGWRRYEVPVGPRKHPIDPALRETVFARDGWHCVACGSTEALRADHVIPESKGGLATLGNLQTLCQRCNSSKGTKSMEEWLAWREQEARARESACSWCGGQTCPQCRPDLYGAA